MSIMALRAVDTLGARDTPLCPAGHLPHRWGDWLGLAARCTLVVWGYRRNESISPLVGEMPGRAEGGNPGRRVSESSLT